MAAGRHDNAEAIETLVNDALLHTQIEFDSATVTIGGLRNSLEAKVCDLLDAAMESAAAKVSH